MKTIDKITSAAILATALGMVAWSFFTGPGQGPLLAVAGILVVAAGIILVIGKGKEYASERGITLQTLIVTAVLVLMAGAAGVVIIAITNSAQDDLENQSSDINARCEPWEIFDPTLDAAGRGGGNGGIDSSASGCVRVCYVEYNLMTAAASTAIGDTINLVDKKAPGVDEAVLKFSRSSGIIETSASAKKHVLPVDGEREVDPDGNTVANPVVANKGIGKIDTQTSVDNYEIKVSPNQRYCHVWNNTDDEEVLRSRN